MMHSTKIQGIKMISAWIVGGSLLFSACNRMPDPPKAVAPGANDSALILYGDAENAYTEAFLVEHDPLYQKLLKEIEERKPTVKAEATADELSFVAPDGKTRLYIKDGCEVYLHNAKGDKVEDVLLLKEIDPTFTVKLIPSASGRYLFIESTSESCSEVYFVSSDLKNSKPQLISPREKGHLYQVNHFDGPYFWILSNQKAPNRKLFVTPVSQPGQVGWNTAVMHNDSVFLNDYFVLEGRYLVMVLNNKLTTRMQITQISGPSGVKEKIDNAIGFNEPLGRIDDIRYESAEGKLVFHYSSVKTPLTCYAYDLQSKKLTIRWKRQVKDYNQENFRAKTLSVATKSGSLLYYAFMQKQDLAYTDGSNPLLIAIIEMPQETGSSVFNPAYLSLMDRGFAMVFLDNVSFKALPTEEQLASLDSIRQLMIKEKNSSTGIISAMATGGSCQTVAEMMKGTDTPFQSAIMINPLNISNLDNKDQTSVFLSSTPTNDRADQLSFLRSASAIRSSWTGSQMLLIRSDVGKEKESTEQRMAMYWTILLRDAEK